MTSASRASIPLSALATAALVGLGIGARLPAHAPLTTPEPYVCCTASGALTTRDSLEIARLRADSVARAQSLAEYQQWLLVCQGARRPQAPRKESLP